MKDINGVDLATGQIVVIAAKSSSGANVPNLKRATILEIFEGNDKIPLPHIKVRYEESGRICKLDGYPGTGYGMDHRVCVL